MWQARPETVASQKKVGVIEDYKLLEKGSKVLSEGRAVGKRIGSGKVRASLCGTDEDLKPPPLALRSKSITWQCSENDLKQLKVVVRNSSEKSSFPEAWGSQSAFRTTPANPRGNSYVMNDLLSGENAQMALFGTTICDSNPNFKNSTLRAILARFDMRLNSQIGDVEV